VGSHRYNRVRRERIPRGSLTFPFARPRDALGNRVIRLGLSYTGRPHRFPLVLSTSRVLCCVCPRGLRRGLRTILLNKTGCFVLHRRLRSAFVNVAQKGVATTTTTVRVLFVLSVHRNYSRTITAHLHLAPLSRQLCPNANYSLSLQQEATLGRNSKLHVKSGRSVLADNMQICFLRMNTPTIYCQRFSSDYVWPSILLLPRPTIIRSRSHYARSLTSGQICLSIQFE